MRENETGAVVIIYLVLLIAFGTAHPAMAQNETMQYRKMAPVEQYLMDRNTEIDLARSAAPTSISRDAEVQALGRDGFETARKGKNGFVCIVGRSWTSSPDFWNPKVRVPMCFNAPAARSYLVRVIKETAWILAGQTQAQLNAAIPAAIAKKELPPMEPGAMCYMMGKQGYAGDGLGHWPPHLMFFYSKVDPLVWGANLPRSPVVAVVDPDEQLTSFVISVQHWSDGTQYIQAGGHVHGGGPVVKKQHGGKQEQ